MPNTLTRVGRYCVFHGIIHKDEYLECDFCNEHKDWIGLNDRYYNYGFSKHSYLACMECHDTLFGPFRIVDGGIMDRAYESIIDVINDRTEKKHIDSEIRDITHINKGFRPIWEFTYKIVSGEETRVKVVNKNPDNLFVSWILGGMTLNEMLKANNMIYAPLTQ